MQIFHQPIMPRKICSLWQVPQSHTVISFIMLLCTVIKQILLFPSSLSLHLLTTKQLIGAVLAHSWAPVLMVLCQLEVLPTHLIPLMSLWNHLKLCTCPQIVRHHMLFNTSGISLRFYFRIQRHPCCLVNLEHHPLVILLMIISLATDTTLILFVQLQNHMH